VQGILQEHVGRGEFIDDAEIAGLAPELGEPPADNGLGVTGNKIALVIFTT
jgi:hypothetical protein